MIHQPARDCQALQTLQCSPILIDNRHLSVFILSIVNHCDILWEKYKTSTMIGIIFLTGLRKTMSDRCSQWGLKVKSSIM